jgi:hypothetical protein
MKTTDFDKPGDLPGTCCLLCGRRYPRGIGWGSCVCGKYHVECYRCRDKAVVVNLFVLSEGYKNARQSRRLITTGEQENDIDGSWLVCPKTESLQIALALVGQTE